MSRISDQDLPAVLSSITTVDGHAIDFVLVRGSLVLFRGDRFEIDSELHEVWDGEEVRHVSHGDSSGSYELTSTQLTLRFIDREGINRVFTYSVLAGGQGLRGEQWERVAEYSRQ